MNYQNSRNPERPGKEPPRFWRRTKPSMARRAPWHDYCAPCFYMITLNKGKLTPRLSEISNEPAAGLAIRPIVRLSATGMIAQKLLQELPAKFQQICIRNVVVMPDHIHFIIQVTSRLEKALGYIIGSYAGMCTAEFCKQNPTSQMATEAARFAKCRYNQEQRRKTALPSSFFTKGFHDRIVTEQGQLPRLVAYINDNPLRYLIRKKYPEYFHTARRLRCGDRIYWAFGNFLLLKNTLKMAVKVSSKYSPQQLADLKQQWKETVKNGGVLISPWISAKEKDIRREALQDGGRIITIVENGFSERYKPQGYEFKLCSEGRLLLISVDDYTTQKEGLSRTKAMKMNEIAAYLASATEFAIKNA